MRISKREEGREIDREKQPAWSCIRLACRKTACVCVFLCAKTKIIHSSRHILIETFITYEEHVFTSSIPFRSHVFFTLVQTLVNPKNHNWKKKFWFDIRKMNRKIERVFLECHLYWKQNEYRNAKMETVKCITQQNLHSWAQDRQKDQRYESCSKVKWCNKYPLRILKKIGVLYQKNFLK